MELQTQTETKGKRERKYKWDESNTCRMYCLQGQRAWGMRVGGSNGGGWREGGSEGVRDGGREAGGRLTIDVRPIGSECKPVTCDQS